MPAFEVLYQTIWLRSGKAYIPTIGRPPSGMFFELEPVEIIEPTRDAFGMAVSRCRSGTFVRVRERDRFVAADWPMSVVQRAAGFRSWRSFARKCLSLALVRGADKWQITAGEGGENDAETVSLAFDSSDELIVEAMVAISEHYTQWKG